MARSSKKSSRRGKRRRVDWVTNPRTYNPVVDTYGLDENDGTIGIPLTISDQSRILQTGQWDQMESWGVMTWSAIPEGNRGSIHAVRGQVQVRTQITWSAGTRLALAMRLAIHEQDAQTLAPIVDPNYSLGINTTFGQDAFNQANERFLWEQKYIKAQSSDLSQPNEFVVPVFWSGRRSIAPNQALFLMLELGDLSTSILFSTWLRTLMTVGE